MLLSSGNGHCLSSLQKELSIKDHTKILFHIKMLRGSGLIEQGDKKAYFLTKQGERAIECLRALEYYLKDE